MHIYLIHLGKPEPEVSQVHLSEIHALKETLKKNNDGLKEIKQQLRELQDRIKSEEEESKVQTSILQGNAELRERIQADERQRLEKENAAILKEKSDNLKLEIEQEKAEVKVYSTYARPQYSYILALYPGLPMDVFQRTIVTVVLAKTKNNYSVP